MIKKNYKNYSQYTLAYKYVNSVNLSKIDKISVQFRSFLESHKYLFILQIIMLPRN